MMEIGAQLYTVREYTKTIEDFAQTLEKIAAIGYRVVQVSGTCAYEPEWLKEQLDRFGLKCVLTHTNVQRMVTETDLVVAEHKQFGCNHIGIGCMPNGLRNGIDDYIAFRNTFRPVGRRIAEQGCRLMYHNHNMEFARYGDSRHVYLEQMAEDFAPEELGFTLDTYWAQAGGASPEQWILKLSGRVPCVHLKDMIFTNHGMHMAPVYEGNMDFNAILAACEAAGTQYLLVEQDDCYGEDPFSCLKKSYQNLKANGL